MAISQVDVFPGSLASVQSLSMFFLLVALVNVRLCHVTLEYVSRVNRAHIYHSSRYY